MSLQRKLLVFLLLCWCAPLYVLVRFFYGRSFAWLVAAALAVNLLALPFLATHLLATHGINLTPFYSGWLNEELALTALYYALPLHLAWMLFYRLSGDGRYDIDHPGRVPVPFLHPWLADPLVAVAFPFFLRHASTWPAFRPYDTSWLPLIELGPIKFAASWLTPAIVMAAVYVLTALITTQPPRFRLPRRSREEKAAPYDVAIIAKMPVWPDETLAEMQARRSAQLRKLLDP